MLPNPSDAVETAAGAHRRHATRGRARLAGGQHTVCTPRAEAVRAPSGAGRPFRLAGGRLCGHVVGGCRLLPPDSCYWGQDDRRFQQPAHQRLRKPAAPGRFRLAWLRRKTKGFRQPFTSPAPSPGRDGPGCRDRWGLNCSAAWNWAIASGAWPCLSKSKPSRSCTWG